MEEKLHGDIFNLVQCVTHPKYPTNRGFQL